MFPISLNLSKISVLLIGSGEAFEKRKSQLLVYGATHLTCHPCESRDLVLKDLDSRLRGNDKIVMVAGLDYSASETIAKEARRLGKLVNVEDIPELCDFYFTSFVKRGELTIAVSTNGSSPTLAKKLRQKIADLFGAEWSNRSEIMKDLRNRLRSEGKTMSEVAKESEKFLDESGWFA